jgi:hypothetical protein
MNVQLQDAAQFLREHFGERLEAGREEGRDLMAEALQEGLGLSQQEAENMVASLEEANTIRWRGQEEAGLQTPAVTPFADVTGGAAPAGPTTSAAIPLVAGYWQL